MGRPPNCHCPCSPFVGTTTTFPPPTTPGPPPEACFYCEDEDPSDIQCFDAPVILGDVDVSDELCSDVGGVTLPVSCEEGLGNDSLKDAIASFLRCEDPISDPLSDGSCSELTGEQVSNRPAPTLATLIAGGLTGSECQYQSLGNYDFMGNSRWFRNYGLADYCGGGGGVFELKHLVKIADQNGDGCVESFRKSFSPVGRGYGWAVSQAHITIPAGTTFYIKTTLEAKYAQWLSSQIYLRHSTSRGAVAGPTADITVTECTPSDPSFETPTHRLSNGAAVMIGRPPREGDDFDELCSCRDANSQRVEFAYKITINSSFVGATVADCYSLTFKTHLRGDTSGILQEVAKYEISMSPFDPCYLFNEISNDSCPATTTTTTAGPTTTTTAGPTTTTTSAPVTTPAPTTSPPATTTQPPPGTP